MKYRVGLDLSFDNEADARALVTHARGMVAKAGNMNPGADNEEVSFADLEIYRHDEGLPCVHLERTEIKTAKEVPDAILDK